MAADLNAAEVEKAKLGAGEEVVISPPSGTDLHHVTRPASSAGDDEKFACGPEAFVRVAVAAEEEAGLPETGKRFRKIRQRSPVWSDHPAVRVGRLVTADDNVLHTAVLLEPRQFRNVPAGLMVDLLLCQRREVGIDHDKPDRAPRKAVPTPVFKMGKPGKEVPERLLIVSVQIVISQDREAGDLSFEPCCMQIVEFTPMFGRAPPRREIAEVDDKSRVAICHLTGDQLPFPAVSFAPELPMARALGVSNDQEVVFTGVDLCKSGIGPVFPGRRPRACFIVSKRDGRQV